MIELEYAGLARYEKDRIETAISNASLSADTPALSLEAVRYEKGPTATLILSGAVPADISQESVDAITASLENTLTVGFELAGGPRDSDFQP